MKMSQEDKDELDSLRKEIDKCDNQLFSILKTRCTLAYKIGHIKKCNNLPVVDMDRFDRMVQDKVIRYSGELLTETFIRKVYNVIHRHSCKVQR